MKSPYLSTVHGNLVSCEKEMKDLKSNLDDFQAELQFVDGVSESYTIRTELFSAVSNLDKAIGEIESLRKMVENLLEEGNGNE